MNQASEPENISPLYENAMQFRARSIELKESDPEESARCERIARALEDGWLSNVIACDLETQKSHHAKWLDDWRSHNEWYRENVRSVISFSQNVQRNLVLINAGAAIAMLTFLGNLLTKSINGNQFVPAIGFFAAGVVLGALTGAAAYVVQLLYGEKDEARVTWGKRGHIAAMVLGILSLGAFVGGCMVAYQAFADQTSEPQVAQQVPFKKNNPLLRCHHPRLRRQHRLCH